MNQISSQQWSRMGQDSFDARLVAILHEHHPQEAARFPLPELVRILHRQAIQARTYGLNDEQSVAMYIYTAWLMGEAFDRRVPSMQQILRDRTLKSSEKAAALAHFSRLVFRALESAAPAESRHAA